jgi:hypothetical protein
MTIMITKTDAAGRQLNTAIRLFFENRDHLSSYALAVASREVTDDVIQSRYYALAVASREVTDDAIQSRYKELYQLELARVGDPQKVRLSYREESKILIKPECYKNLINLHNRWQNFLKHAKTDPDAEMEPFKAKQLALVILTAMTNYFLLTEHWTTEMNIFFAWSAVAEPQWLKSAPGDVMTKAIAEIRSGISGDPYDRDTLETIYTAMSATYRNS